MFRLSAGPYLLLLRLNRPDALPRTEALNDRLIRLPAFPQADRALLDQYAEAFAKVLDHARAVADHVATLAPPTST